MPKQPAITHSKSTKETQEEAMKQASIQTTIQTISQQYKQVNNTDARATSLMLPCCYHHQLHTYFTPCCSLHISNLNREMPT